jgi:hypothetical protein
LLAAKVEKEIPFNFVDFELLTIHIENLDGHFFQSPVGRLL